MSIVATVELSPMRHLYLTPRQLYRLRVHYSAVEWLVFQRGALSRDDRAVAECHGKLLYAVGPSDKFRKPSFPGVDDGPIW
jgi:hypothetical protein